MDFPKITNFTLASGFSNYFSSPSYKRGAVSNFSAQHDPGRPYYIANAKASNVQRTIAGKGPTGFINSVVYENPQMFSDIVNDSSLGCGSSGFKAAPDETR
ncbi:hypothetical protein LTR36_008496 [Oleoguttula mirabilis]|uniref:Uncharacterized protein n=1 Tax=Oleoguttula mirabilis TaxID=1507867 RepID=A0AAV9JT58_9PEZI|nr:hypothetical protein LTR36_008496 [Oleoguttula mirabilis]